MGDVVRLVHPWLDEGIGTIDPNPPALLRRKPVIATSAYSIHLNHFGFATSSRAIRASASDDTPSTPPRASCHRRSTWARSGRGWPTLSWTSSARRMLGASRHVAEGKSCGRTTQRLSNSPGLGAFGGNRRASSRNAGGASYGKLIWSSASPPRHNAPMTGPTSTACAFDDVGPGTTLYSGTGRYPRVASARPVLTESAPGRSTTIATPSPAGGAQFTSTAAGAEWLPSSG